MRVDLNVDLGEDHGRWADGQDSHLLRLVTSANVCCGAYAGDDGLIRDTCAAAVEHGVAIGAQVGYRDREGFGRRSVDIAPRDLTDEVRRQIDHLTELADGVGGIVTYVKPHGALYHRIGHDEAQAAAVVEALLADAVPLPLVGMPHSLALRFAQDEGIAIIREGFADRAYDEAGDLVPRDRPGAVITAQHAAASQAVGLLGVVDSICVHSDSPGAVDLLTAVRATLADRGVEVEAFS